MNEVIFKKRTRAVALRVAAPGDDIDEIVPMTVASIKTLRQHTIENRKSKIENQNA